MSKTFTIYRSSAGSGKTRTLAKEYLKLALRFRADYFRHILAVTFTNKATQEMKDRILAYLSDFSNAKPSELAEELKTELNLDELTFQHHAQAVQAAILHQYAQFSISTIDAFFQKVIRSFTREAGLVGDYRLEIEQDAVLEEVIDNLIDELGNNRELTEWVVEFAKENLENERAWDVRYSLIEFSREIFREEFRAIEDEVMGKTADRKFFKDLRSDLWRIKSSFLTSISAPASEALAIIRSHGWDITDISYGKNSGLFSFFEMCAYEKNLKELRAPSDRIRSYFTQAANWPGKKSPRAAEIVAVADQKLIPLLQTLIDRYDRDFIPALSAEVALRNLYVYGLIADISRKLKEYKDENNLMLLADAPKFLSGVIQDSDTPFIYEKVGSFYKNYLIDEFQDTSGLQWNNFLPLLESGLDQGYASLVVGDVKQAIYRWRGGDLKLLQQEIEQNIGHERVEVKTLNSNFRSSVAVVDFNNALFETAASLVAAETGHVISADAYKDVAQNVSKKDTGFVQVKFLQEDEDTRWKNLALDEIPRYLEKLQDIGVPLKDIALLVRKNDEGQQIVAHLLQYRSAGQAKPGYRYDVVSNESLRLDGAASVNLLLGAMKYLLNPDDDIARAQLAFEFARLYDVQRPYTEVFAVTNQTVFESYLPATFTKEKGMLKKLPLFELAETLIEIFRLGEQQGELAYLQAFQDLVLDFFSRERNDLGAFLEWWEDNKHKKSVQVSGEVDAAQIITVHKSKGLQFRYVIIPFCAWSMDHDAMKAPNLWVSSSMAPFDQAGYLPVKYSGTLNQTLFQQHYEEEHTRSYLDNLNLLYVALTRAEHGLMVMAPHPDVKASKKTVAQLLYQSIQRDDRLHKDWREADQVLMRGTWQAGQVATGKETANTLSLSLYPAFPWRDKLVIRQSAKGYFDQKDEEKHRRIVYGIHMHTVLSRIKEQAEIPAVLERLVLEGHITEGEMAPLQTQLGELMSDTQIASWFSPAWDVRTEVPILLPDSAGESRIDRLLLKDRRAIVIDFKTGVPLKTDQYQVQEYMNILHKMNYVEVEGYVLYVRTGEVVSVTTTKAKVVKRKDDNQLALGI